MLTHWWVLGLSDEDKMVDRNVFKSRAGALMSRRRGARAGVAQYCNTQPAHPLDLRIAYLGTYVAPNTHIVTAQRI